MSLLFRQLFEAESSTYTYILADSKSKEAIIIDPVQETFDRDISLIEEMGLKIKFTVETHIHADHITSAKRIKEKTGAKMVLGAGSKLETADILLKENETLEFGEWSLKAIPTPGHTDSCTSYYLSGYVFTGDTLLIRGCGRTDFQQGSSQMLFHSVREKLFKLPDETLVYPAHDYKGRTCSSILEEKNHNPRLNLSVNKNSFVEIMKNLNLDKPKKIDIAVPANLNHGEA